LVEVLLKDSGSLHLRATPQDEHNIHEEVLFGDRSVPARAAVRQDCSRHFSIRVGHLPVGGRAEPPSLKSASVAPLAPPRLNMPSH
jgi:hypothetical protein